MGFFTVGAVVKASGIMCCVVPAAALGAAGGIAWLVAHWRRLREGWRVKRGKGLAVGELARRLGMEEAALRQVEVRYTERRIPKRRGGERVLQVPAPELMEVQRKILRKVLGKLRAHPAAHGFEQGKSIVTNANPHAGRAVVIKMDVKDFFPATGTARVEAYLQRVGWNKEAAGLLTRLVTWQGGLPQGAPTSPRLSNLVNYALDARLARWAKGRYGVYTRYADDITFSYWKDIPSRNRGTVQVVRRKLKRLGYQMHEEKTRILRGHQQKRVTGLVVHGTPALPRGTRRWLRAVKHRLEKGEAITMTRQQLAGWAALEAMVKEQAKAPEQRKKARGR